VLIDELLVVCDDGLCDGLSDGIDLGGVTTARDADTDVDVGELVETSDQDWLVDLESQDLWLDEVEGLAVDLDESFTGLYSIQLVFRPVRIFEYVSWWLEGRSCIPCSGRLRWLINLSESLIPQPKTRHLKLTGLLLAEALHTLG
jgi:hypothetical protein